MSGVARMAGIGATAHRCPGPGTAEPGRLAFARYACCYQASRSCRGLVSVTHPDVEVRLLGTVGSGLPVNV